MLLDLVDRVHDGSVCVNRHRGLVVPASARREYEHRVPDDALVAYQLISGPSRMFLRSILKRRRRELPAIPELGYPDIGRA